MLSLTLGQVRKLRKALKTDGRKLPKVGYFCKLPGSNVELHHDARGYFLCGGSYQGISNPETYHGHVYITVR